MEEVKMTAEERAEFEAFRREKAHEAELKRIAEQREMYKDMVDEEIENSIPELVNLSLQIKATKKTVYENFAAILDMKNELFAAKMKDGQRSHTFTNSEGTKRITLGHYVTDGYRDTVEDGIAIVKEYISSLASTPETEALVGMVFRLLSRDQKGTLKASRVIQLRRIAEQSGSDRFMEGVKIIEDAWQPSISKQFVRAEVKDDKGQWTAVPLGMTES